MQLFNAFLYVFLLSTMERRGVLLQYFAKSAELKRKAVCKYIEEMLESDCKFLVFAHHMVNISETSGPFRYHCEFS